MAVTSRSDVLYAADFRQKLAPLLGPGTPSFSRSGAARLLTAEGRYAKLRRDQYRGRWTPIDLDDAGTLARRKGLLLEKGVTPKNDDSAAFDPSTTAWSASDCDVTELSSTGIFDDDTFSAWRLTGGGGVTAFERVTQGIGSFSSGKEAYQAIYEEDTAAGTAITVRDKTDGVETRLELDWSNLSTNFASTGASSSETAVLEKLSDHGPNGGVVVRLAMIYTPATSGNSREIRVHPNDPGTDNTDSTIVHLAQHEELAFPTSPIPYTGSAVARQGEEFIVSPGPYDSGAVQAFYLSWVAGTLIGDTGSFLRNFAHGDGSDPQYECFMASSNHGRIEFRFNDANGNRAGFSNRIVDLPSPKPGQLVEVVYVFDPSDGQVRQMGRLDGANLDVSGGTPSSWTTPSSLGSDDRIVYNEGGGAGGSQRGAKTFLRHHGVLGSSLDNDPMTATAADVMDEMAGIFVGPQGSTVSLNT